MVLNVEHRPSKVNDFAYFIQGRQNLLGPYEGKFTDHNVEGSDFLEGSLLDRGIGFYYTYEEVQESGDQDGPLLLGNINPGHFIGFTLGAIYVAWPLDFIPDFIPVLGYLDDAVILSGATNLGGWLWDLMD